MANIEDKKKITVQISLKVFHKITRLATFHRMSLDQIVEGTINDAPDLGEKEKRDLEDRTRAEMKMSKEM